MNRKLWLISAIAVFVVIAVSGYLFHGWLLQPIYADTVQYWRPEAEFSKRMPAMLLGQAIFAFAFAFVFTIGYEAKGPLEGLRYGFYLFLVFVPWNVLTQYTVMPLPDRLFLYWAGIGMVQFLLCGLVAASIYRE